MESENGKTICHCKRFYLCRLPGWGKQELRKLESNEAATTMNMLLFGMTELATWNRSQSELVNREESPWDDEKRRPSHADRRNEYTTNT